MVRPTLGPTHDPCDSDVLPGPVPHKHIVQHVVHLGSRVHPAAFVDLLDGKYGVAHNELVLGTER